MNKLTNIVINPLGVSSGTIVRMSRGQANEVGFAVFLVQTERTARRTLRESRDRPSVCAVRFGWEEEGFRQNRHNAGINAEFKYTIGCAYRMRCNK